ncbi:cardiolipin synthase [Neobacillus sp. D3-1R]|uniref:cardiolipin synthase n=1 Tax=Neobacillus sp. D3-1R TaxID=3445778 RepID=UPI003F9EFDFD
MTLNFTLGVLGVLFLIFLWLTLDYWLGRTHHLKKFVPPNAPKRQSQMELFTDGEVFFKDYFAELKNAKKHIHILFYIVKNDRFSKEFFQILTQKAKEGVEVRLLLDFLGSLKVNRKMINDFKAAGGQFSFSNIPKLPFLFYSSQTRNHRKISVIDGVIGCIGGFNIGKEYVNKDQKLSPWRDYQLKITGEGVNDLQREFLMDWRQCTKTDLLQNPIYFPNQKSGPVEHEIIPSEGVYLETTFLKLIDSAKDSLMIGSPYFIPSQRTFFALMAALRRGVKVTILVPKIPDHMLVKEASFPFFRRLIREGATVYQYLNGFYHAKTLIIDDRVCDIGTANFDKRSMFLNHEINCYMYDKDFIKQLRNTIEKDIKDSKILTLEELNQPNILRTVKEKTATLFSQFL